MATEVGICNSALLKIGQERISSLSENSKRAIACNEQFEKLKHEVLRSHPWNCAIDRVDLGQLSDAPAFGYDYAYQLPTACLKVLSVQDDEVEFKIEGRKLICNETEISIRFVKDVDPSEFDACLAEALACRLAADLAFGLAQNATLQASMMAAYREQLKLARSMDAHEGTPEEHVADTWLNSRN